MPTVDDVVAALPAEIHTIVAGGPDSNGIMRGKRLPVGQLERVLREGLAICDVFWVLTIDESDLVRRPATAAGYFPTERTGYPDIIARADLSTLRVVPWHDGTAFVLCDWRLPHEAGPVPLDPRHVLRTVVERGRAMGFDAYSALELEFYLLRETPGSVLDRHPWELTPLEPRPSTYGVVMGARQEPVARLIRESMLAYGIPVEACNPETGPGQFEINLRYGPSLRAADDAFLFKSGVKELAAQQELLATFMAKPNSDWAGNSCHAHMSLRTLDGDPAFHDDTAPHGVSELMRHFVGGVLASMPDLTALMAPTPNSYRRYTPYSWAGTTATWGVDNRSTGLRAIVEGPAGTRLEHRQPGGDANPYLVTAAMLAAGLHGIENGIEPPEPVGSDVYGMSTPPGTALPRSLAAAVDLLEGSTTARQWLGDDFVDHYVELKRAEVEAQALAVTDWEIRRYLDAL